jgi:hypothetical protein
MAIQPWLGQRASISRVLHMNVCQAWYPRNGPRTPAEFPIVLLVYADPAPLKLFEDGAGMLLRAKQQPAQPSHKSSSSSQPGDSSLDHLPD